MSLDLAMDQFESAAKAAGYLIEEEKDWPYTDAYVANLRRLGVEAEPWPQDSFDRDAARSALVHRGVRVNEEYLSVMERWNGLGLRREGQDKSLIQDYELRSFKRSLSEYDGIQSWAGGDPEFWDLTDKFFCLFTITNLDVGWLTAPGSGDVLVSYFEGYPCQPLFLSFENFFNCLVAAVEAGVDLRNDDEYDNQLNTKNKLAFAQICFEHTKWLESWRDTIDDLNQLLSQPRN